MPNKAEQPAQRNEPAATDSKPANDHASGPTD